MCLWGLISISGSKVQQDDLTGNQTSSHTQTQTPENATSTGRYTVNHGQIFEFFWKQCRVFVPLGEAHAVQSSSEGHSDLYGNDGIKVASEHENKWNHPSLFSHAWQREITNSEAGIRKQSRGESVEMWGNILFLQLFFMISFSPCEVAAAPHF